MYLKLVDNILSLRLIIKYFYGHSLPAQIQEGQLSVSGERMCTVLVNHLEGLSLPSKRVVR